METTIQLLRMAMKTRDIGAAEVERRVNKRLITSLPILLPTGKAYTKDISAGGLYFELEPSNADLYAIGQKIPVWVHASYGSEANVPQQLWLFVNAIVVRKVVDSTQPDRCGMGLMFMGKFDITLCTVRGLY